MSMNGENNVDEAEMSECEGEKVVTMMDVLQEQQEFEEDANAVLGASDDMNCTYPKGYIKRQALYACLTCCTDAQHDKTKRAGVCLACSLNCHENHELIELYTKRNFRCDCGNPKFNSHPCQFTPNKTELNTDNNYNQNFSGIYCICHRPYPDPEATVEEDMIQCIVCEDWFHTTHLDAAVPSNDQYSEMVCKACMEKNEFLHDYSHIAVNVEMGEIDIVSVNGNDSLCNGKGDGNISNGDIIDEKIANDMETETSLVTNDVESTSSDKKEETNTETSSEVDKNNENTENMDTGDLDTITDKVTQGENNESVMENTEQIAPESSENTTENVTDTIENKPESDNITDTTENKPETDNVTDTTENKPETDNITDTIENKPESDNITDTTENKPETDNITDTKENKPETDNITDTIENKPESDNITDTTENKPETDNITDTTENKPETDNVTDTTENKSETDNITDTTENKLDTNNIAETIEKGNADSVSEGKKDITEESKSEENSCEVNKEENGEVDTITQEKSTETTEKESIHPDTNEVDDKIDASDVAHKTDSNKNGTKDEPDSTEINKDQPINVPAESHEKTAEPMDTVENENNEASTDEINNETVNTKPDDIADSTESTEDNKESTMDETEININSNESEKNETIEPTTSTDKQNSISDDQTNGSSNNLDEAKDSEVTNQPEKRKMSEENNESHSKKPKLDTTCIRPRNVKRIYKGATFWPSHFRQKLCTCNECISMYKDLSVLYLIDPEDTVSAYETLGKERNDGEPSTQYEKGLKALSSLNRVQQINALTEYNKMRDKLLDYLKSFKDRKEVVKEEDIKAFFAGMKPKREPDGVYFCR